MDVGIYSKLLKEGKAIKKLLIAATVAILAIAVGVLWHNHSVIKSSVAIKAHTNSPNKSSSIDQGFGYLSIEQNKVRIPLTDKTQNLKLGKISTSFYNPNDEYVTIIAPELNDSWMCSPDHAQGIKATIGNISITSQTKRSGPYEPLATKKIGQYTYGLEANTSSNCTDSQTYKDLVEEFKVQFLQMEGY